MNVLHLVADMNPKTGGVCQAIQTIVGGLSKLGIHNEVASVDSPDAPYLKPYWFPVHALGPAQNVWHYSASLVPWLVENMSRFDVVIVHGLWLYPSHAIQKAIRQLKKKTSSDARLPRVYVMPHGMLDPWFQEAKGRELKALRNWMYWKLIEDKVVNNADGILFTCEEELLLARKPFRPYRPSREINVGYGIDSSPAFLPAMRTAFLEKCPTMADQPYLLFLSRIDVKKGVDLLIDAYAQLLQQMPAMGIDVPKLLIVGPGQETPYGQRIQKMVTETESLRDKVVFAGMLTGNAKWGAFYGCTAFVLPSHQENFGIAVVEALACSKPVLISNQVNIWREIEAEGGGFIAPNSVDGTRHILTNWLTLSESEKRQMEKRARSAFEKHFFIGPAAERIAAAIDQ